MLKLADRFEEDVTAEDVVITSSSAAPSTTRPTAVSPDSRYGQQRSVSISGIAIVILIHAILIFAMVQVRQNYVRHKEERLSVVNLMPPPPPPPASAAPTPPAKPEIVAPAPIVETPVRPVQTVQTTTDPTPAPPAPPVAAPPAPPAVSFAPPSVVSGGDLSTQMVAGKPPRYPIDSRRKREQGTVVLSLTLGIDGAVESILIAHSSGFARLDDAAKDAVKRWRWRPTIQNGQPVRVKGVVEIPFVIAA